MDNICDKYICYLDQKFKEALYIGKNTYPVPHCAPVFLLFLRIQTSRISRVRSNTPPATHRIMMTVSIFTSSRTIMLVPFFAAVSDTSETNASSIIKDKPSVPMNPSYTMLESLRDWSLIHSCSTQAMLSLGNVFLGSVRMRGQSHIILQCMIKTTVPHTLQVCWIPREPRRADIGLFYRLYNNCRIYKCPLINIP